MNGWAIFGAGIFAGLSVGLAIFAALYIAFARDKGYTLNRDGTVAVSLDTYWEPIETCPPRVKVQLLGNTGVATYGVYEGRVFWTHWAPLPRRPQA